MKKFLKKNGFLILGLILIICIISIFEILYLKNKKNSDNDKKTDVTDQTINKISEKNYSFNYDNTWEIKKLKDTEIELNHIKSESTLNIKINELDENTQYQSIDELFTNLLYNIQTQNKDYKLLYKEETSITKNNISCYKMLFENKNNQVEIYLYKVGNEAVILSYEASSEYFDLVLDSAKSIINSFLLEEEKFDVMSSINLETKTIEYSKQDELVALLNGEIQEELSGEKYLGSPERFLVNFSIPSIFKLESDSSKQFGFKSYVYRNSSSKLPYGAEIRLTASIVQNNIYEYLDKDNYDSIFKSYNYTQNDGKDAAIDKFGTEPLSYIFKNTNLSHDIYGEIIEIVFELDKNHILKIELNSLELGIPEELVKLIKVNKITETE